MTLWNPSDGKQFDMHLCVNVHKGGLNNIYNTAGQVCDPTKEKRWGKKRSMGSKVKTTADQKQTERPVSHFFWSSNFMEIFCAIKSQKGNIFERLQSSYIRCKSTAFQKITLTIKHGVSSVIVFRYFHYLIKNLFIECILTFLSLLVDLYLCQKTNIWEEIFKLKRIWVMLQKNNPKHTSKRTARG